MFWFPCRPGFCRCNRFSSSTWVRTRSDLPYKNSAVFGRLRAVATTMAPPVISNFGAALGQSQVKLADMALDAGDFGFEVGLESLNVSGPDHEPRVKAAMS